jgi:hypothetical protein
MARDLRAFAAAAALLITSGMETPLPKSRVAF